MINKSNEFKNIDILNTCVTCIGVILVLIGCILPFFVEKAWVIEVKTILLSVACSIIASSIITFFISRYQIKRENIKGIIDHWGLENIYPTRAVMNQVCDEKQKHACECIDVAAFGLRSWRQSCENMVRGLLRSGVRIRILAPIPDTEIIRKREEDEEDSPGNISQNIIKLNEWVEQLKSEGNIELRFYDGLPIDFYFRVDNTLFIGPYQSHKQSQHTVSFEYSGDGQMFRDYTEHYEMIWKRNAPK